MAWCTVFCSSCSAVEVGLTLWDFVVEDRTRRLSPVERTTHVVLSMTGGAYVGFLNYLVLNDWIRQATRLEPVSYGWVSVVFKRLRCGVYSQ